MRIDPQRRGPALVGMGVLWLAHALGIVALIQPTAAAFDARPLLDLPAARAADRTGIGLDPPAHHPGTRLLTCNAHDMGMLDSDSFDLAMLDVHLNGKTVFPFAAELEARGIPFMFATAYGARGLPVEFRDYLVLQKPFGPVELRRALIELSGRTTH